MPKALTITQPWASLVALGIKRIETRSWATAYRGPLLIHAAKGSPDRDFEHRLKERWILPIAGPLPLGAIVARCRLVGIHSTNEPAFVEGLAELEAELGDYSRNRFGWLLEDVEAIAPPIPWRGALGLWEGPAL